jgi:hypothetical protein
VYERTATPVPLVDQAFETSMSVRKNLGAAFVFAFVFLEACGNAVSPQSDGGRDAMGGDASAGCRLRNGEFCPVGQTCPAGDGCNECSCLAEGNLAHAPRVHRRGHSDDLVSIGR